MRDPTPAGNRALQLFAVPYVTVRFIFTLGASGVRDREWFRWCPRRH
ncbi:hypothetical protein KKY_657 [Pelagibacterium halotolerans B2]|uniref:Uncharacterized protein n=1 Tax=Pelagibacterium halotolerans (strain DSM 22347 / JCM 15775 / CGMCC 1.7692 / B2) TaxID=1082931 RepID=G4RCM4_PELHB|nr:hypothetical protein KKY_657 [Pelagibacterium halotolerans B2]